MILTCPSCGTQYVVKDGAIPPAGRQVRCKACQHSWHEMPSNEAALAEMAKAAPPAPARVSDEPAPHDTRDPPREDYSSDNPSEETISDAQAEDALPEDLAEGMADGAAYEDEEPLPDGTAGPPIPPEAEITGLAEAGPSSRIEWVEQDEEFSPFAARVPEKQSSRKIVIAAVAVLLIVALVAALWFFAPPELRQRMGIADSGETPLKLMMTHSDRTQLASGNEFLNISGRIINPTDELQKVPPITAQLHDASGKVVYKWTIPPPTRTIPPGGSASFNSAELNIPPAAQELTVTLGEPKI